MSDLLKALDDHGLKVDAARDAGEVVGWLDTGNLALNYAISGSFDRGYPLGHAVEIFGDPSTGKSFLVARAVAEAQARGGAALLDDTEGAFSPEWAERALGVDVDALGLRKSMTVEEHRALAGVFLSAVQSLAERDTKEDEVRPYLLACDSLALLTTEDEMGTDFGEEKMQGARRAKLIRRMFREVGGEVAKLPIVYIATNHTIANIGNPFGPNKTTPGGSGPKYQASVRLDLRTPKKLKNSGEVIGVRIRIIVNKNRVSAPFRETVMTIPYHRSISKVSGLIPILLDLGVLGESGRTLTFREEDTGISTYKSKSKILHQDRSAEELLAEYPEVMEDAAERVQEIRKQDTYSSGEDED